MQGFCRLPGCLQDSLLSSCHPKCVRTLYDAGAVSLPDLLRIIQEHEHAGNGFRPFRLRSAGGTFYKVVKNGKRPLADLLAGASVGDREADIEELVSAASKVYEKHFVAGLGEKMRSQDDVKHFLKKKTNCRFTQFAPLAHRPAGTYKRFFDCFEACDRAAGGVRGLRMRFNRLGAFRSAVINGREVHIPRNTQLVVRETPVPKDNGEMEKKLAVVMYAPLDKVFFPLVTVLSDGQAYFINAGLELEALVQCWEEDSVTASEVIGVACRHCLFCDRELVDPTSVARGIGPVCAKNFRSALKLITEPHTSGPVMGAHVQPQPQKAVNIALANGTSVALSIPPRLLKESAVLEGLLDCDGDLPDAAILNGLLGIDAATLDVLDRMLETPGWFPEAQDDIVSALAAADALGLAAPQRLLQMVFLEGSAELVVGTVVESTEVLAKAVVRRAIAKALAASLGESCELTPFKLPKRTLEIDTYVNLRSAIEKSDVEALQRMLAEGVSLARPTKLPQKYGNATLPSQAMSAPLEVADMLLAHGMDWPEEERKRAQLEAAGCVCQAWHAHGICPGDGHQRCQELGHGPRRLCHDWRASHGAACSSGRAGGRRFVHEVE